MGYEDQEYFTIFVKMPIQAWLRYEIGDSYTQEIEYRTSEGIERDEMVGTVISKNAGELVVRFEKPKDMA